jgi:hypothetical protein
MQLTKSYSRTSLNIPGKFFQLPFGLANGTYKLATQGISQNIILADAL